MPSTHEVIAQLPPHLRRYVVNQDYGSYTPRDQAVWRYILKRLTSNLRETAHPSYLRGLEATGIGVERIPSLDDMNARLETLGWRAVGVRGFVPPAVFTELQAMGVLAIASDIRTHEHVAYTPAPDIVHESAGHAPILADGRYGEYLRRCGVVGFKSIASLEDQAVYEAIRNLSVVKEDPAATPEDHALAQARLEAASASRREVSESTKASRLYWWTAEYGLVGDLEHPRIYGAGLLSSLGEAEHCLRSEVLKVPLSLVCADTEYDITRMQPQLFVARDFDHLFEVLEAFESTLAWKRGGDFGLGVALRARTVNHLVLSNGLEVTGRVVRVEEGRGPGLRAALAVLEGPTLVSRGGKAQDRPWSGSAVVAFGVGALPHRGTFELELDSGLSLRGFRVDDAQVVNLRGTLEGRDLDLPTVAQLHLSEALPSVAGGPADPGTWDRWFGELHAFAAGDSEQVARDHRARALAPELGALYEALAQCRATGNPVPEELRGRVASYPEEWLLREELS